MMHKIIVLGAGMVGRAIAIDLAKTYDITVADIQQGSLDRVSGHRHIQTVMVDLSDRNALAELIQPFDFVVSAVPGFLGWQTLHTVISNQKSIVDISFLPEDALPLDALAKSNGVTAIMDCGVAPGIPNIIAGYYAARTKVTRFEYMVGGLPLIRTQPFEYKAPFSPCDVIEEYTRPARFVENGRMVTKPALSEPELIDFPEVGTLEAFNSDGLRSLITTLPGIPYMKEKTLRYPGHIDKIRLLRDAGFFETTPIRVAGTALSPLAFTSEILKKAWMLHPEEEEFTIMKILLDLEEGGVKKRIVCDLFDRYDQPSGTSSMARTTGYTCTAAVQMVLSGRFTEKGLFPPEQIGTLQEHYDYLLQHLSDRGVVLKFSFAAI